MGSRYGGLKQLDPMGLHGETLLDYSVFDAVRAGFDRVVFVIRPDFEDEFRGKIGARFEKHVEVAYAFQELGALPGGFQPPAGREKPWGTGHAIWCARDAVRKPFAVINADDFYGRGGYRVMGDFLPLLSDDREDEPASFAMVAYRLGRTLSDHGSVSRGICAAGADGFLHAVEEFTAIEKVGGKIRCILPDGSQAALSGNETVSLNFWGFTPRVFPLLEEGLRAFLSGHLETPKSEYYIPSAVAGMIRDGRARVRVLPTDAEWFGVTYREDKPLVAASLARLIAAGEYPQPLWG